MLVYDVTNEESFWSIRYVIMEIKQVSKTFYYAMCVVILTCS